MLLLLLLLLLVAALVISAYEDLYDLLSEAVDERSVILVTTIETETKTE